MSSFFPFGNMFGSTDDSNKGTTKNGMYQESVGGDSMTRFMRSTQNQLAATGGQNEQQGSATLQQGIGALGPVLQQLTSLVNGDQADVSQATQPQANQIRDSFAAVRNMISQQPRGGGKTSALAEAPFKEQQQISDMRSQARQAATGQLGSIASGLAGLGLEEQGLGQQGVTTAAQSNLERRGQDMGVGSMSSQGVPWVQAIV